MPIAPNAAESFKPNLGLLSISTPTTAPAAPPDAYAALRSTGIYVENVIDEQLHDPDPVCVRARRCLAYMLLSPLRLCGGWDGQPGGRRSGCGREFWITSTDDALCPRCQRRQARCKAA